MAFAGQIISEILEVLTHELDAKWLQVKRKSTFALKRIKTKKRGLWEKSPL